MHDYTWEEAAELLREYLESEDMCICTNVEWINAGWKMQRAAQEIKRLRKQVSSLEELLPLCDDFQTTDCITENSEPFCKYCKARQALKGKN